MKQFTCVRAGTLLAHGLSIEIKDWSFGIQQSRIEPELKPVIYVGKGNFPAIWSVDTEILKKEKIELRKKINANI